MPSASDLFSTHRPGLAGPYTHAAAITPHNTNELSFVTRAIHVGVAGDLKLTTVDGDTVTMTAVPVGVLPIRARLVFATGTAAQNLTALW